LSFTQENPWASRSKQTKKRQLEPWHDRATTGTGCANTLEQNSKKGITVAHNHACGGKGRAKLLTWALFFKLWWRGHATVRRGHTKYFCTGSSYFCLQSAPNHILDPFILKSSYKTLSFAPRLNLFIYLFLKLNDKQL